MASRGVLVRAQMPPAMPKTVRIMTRKALRELASMMRSISGVERGASGAWGRGASGAVGAFEELEDMESRAFGAWSGGAWRAWRAWRASGPCEVGDAFTL